MEGTMTAIEMTGTVDEHHQLHLDGVLSISGPRRVRLMISTVQRSAQPFASLTLSGHIVT